MTDAAWIDDPIGYMIAPTDKQTFLDKFHERQFLWAQHGDPDRFSELLSMARIDELIATNDMQQGQLDMTRADPPISHSDFTFESGLVDRGAVARHFQKGGTIILPQLQGQDRTLARFCRALELVFSCHVQTNIYLTPPNAQGFKTHYDDHDVFVLQISGEKRWRLYNTPVENPYRGEGFDADRHKAGEPVEDFVLKAGDCVYVPRGLMHDAVTHDSDQPSLHITVGLIVKTWADLMLEAVSEVAIREPEFRRSLPAGFADPDFDRSGAQAQFKALTQALAEKADLDGAFDMFVDNFIRGRLPASDGAVLGFEAHKRSGQAFRLRPQTPWRLAEDGEDIVIITAGGEVRLPAAAEPAIHTLLDGGVIDASSFESLSEDERIDALGQLHAFGLAIPV